MPEDHQEDATPRDRRSFFREAIFSAMRPAADYLEKKLPTALRSEAAGPLVLLRPPGAIDEAAFLDTCYRCGSCADHCPADAISLFSSDAPPGTASANLKGTPYIEPSERACVICDELACMKACPSGALRLVERTAIRIGMAIVDHAVCVRAGGEACTICVDMCPIGRDAIRVGDDGRIEVIDPSCSGLGCTGCGVCEERCPTRPIRAIQIRAYPERRLQPAAP